jgi:flagellar FliJ protein
MAKPFSLQPLVHLAQKKTNTDIKTLGFLINNHQAAQNKLNMLQQYRKDYQEKMQSTEKEGMGLEDLRNFQDFIYRLDDAIAQQNNVVMQAQSAVTNGQNELVKSKTRMNSFETLAQRHVLAEKNLEAKLEQKTQDEHSGRRAAYKNAEPDTEY